MKECSAFTFNGSLPLEFFKGMFGYANINQLHSITSHKNRTLNIIATETSDLAALIKFVSKVIVPLLMLCKATLCEYVLSTY